MTTKTPAEMFTHVQALAVRKHVFAANTLHSQLANEPTPLHRVELAFRALACVERAVDDASKGPDCIRCRAPLGDDLRAAQEVLERELTHWCAKRLERYGDAPVVLCECFTVMQYAIALRLRDDLEVHRLKMNARNVISSALDQ